jgi:SET domain-containing protein
MQSEVGQASSVTVGRGRHGRGVFATRRLATGEPVEVCPTLRLPDADVAGELSDYVFGSGTDGEVLLLLGLGMLYNHSATPNLEYFQDEPDAIAFFAARDIEPGEELTIDYGTEWWEQRGLEPD